MTHAASETAVIERPQPGTSAALATVVYRSRAVAPLPDQDLQHLIRSAQSRNQREAITGVVLYDNSHFFQWLEGPADGVARVMDSILGDARHTDLEVLTRRTAATRRFKDWDMKLAAPGAMARDWRGEVIEPPPEIIADLRRQPAAAPSLLIKLVPSPEAAAQAGRDQVSAAARIRV
jgi:hypothetical protein